MRLRPDMVGTEMKLRLIQQLQLRLRGFGQESRENEFIPRGRLAFGSDENKTKLRDVLHGSTVPTPSQTARPAQIIDRR